LGLLLWSADAAADASSPPASAPSNGTIVPIIGERTFYQPPNRPLLIGGLIAFGAGYVPSVIIAAEANTTFDNYLYIPIVGPWLDLANRPQCGGTFQPRCSTETGRKIVLAANGVLQAAGAAAIVLGLALPGKHSELVTAKLGPAGVLHMDIVPSQLSADGYGVTAVGDF
jgi:hypothetical protein